MTARFPVAHMVFDVDKNGFFDLRPEFGDPKKPALFSGPVDVQMADQLRQLADFLDHYNEGEGVS